MIPARRRAVLRSLTALLALWLAGAAMMWMQSGPASLDPAGRRYGMNRPGDLQRLLFASVAEVLVLCILLPPWTRTPAWVRLLGVAAVGAPYVVLRLLSGVHGGPIMAAHDGWLALVWLGVLLASPVAGVRARRARSAGGGSGGEATPARAP